MVIGLLRIIAIVCVAAACGKMLSKVKLPSILGWLIAGIVFGPYLSGVVTLDITNALWYKAAIKLFECFAGVMIGREILSRAAGKIGGAFLGGKLTKAEPAVTKYLGFTLLPHSGVSLVFTGIAVTTLTSVDSSLAAIVSGTIVAAAIINEIIAVIVAKFAFKLAGEIKE